jgi:hypothetical protein
MTKSQIQAEARAHGYNATYSARLKEWFFARLWPSKNTRGFESVVLANLKRKCGL